MKPIAVVSNYKPECSKKGTVSPSPPPPPPPPLKM